MKLLFILFCILSMSECRRVKVQTPKKIKEPKVPQNLTEQQLIDEYQIKFDPSSKIISEQIDKQGFLVMDGTNIIGTLKSLNYTVLYLYKPQCPRCRTLKRNLMQIQEELKKDGFYFTLGKINGQRNDATAIQFGVRPLITLDSRFSCSTHLQRRLAGFSFYELGV